MLFTEGEWRAVFFVSGLVSFAWLVFTAVSLSDIASTQKRIANVLERRYGEPGSEPKKPGEEGSGTSG